MEGRGGVDERFLVLDGAMRGLAEAERKIGAEIHCATVTFPSRVPSPSASWSVVLCHRESLGVAKRRVKQGKRDGLPTPRIATACDVGMFAGRADTF